MRQVSAIAANSGKVLIIKAKGGLGNRMLSAVTGILLAQLNRRDAFIDWRDGMYVEPGENLYPLLFEADGRDAVDQFDGREDVAPSIWSNRMAMHPTDIIHQHFPRQHQDPFLYRKLSIDLHRQDPSEAVAVFWSYLPKIKRLENRLAQMPELADKGQADIMSDVLKQYFRPVSEVTQKVDAIFAEMSSPIIGVHIRFTDRKVPLPKIVSELTRLKRANPDAQIFLATDSQEAQNEILTRFPDTRTIDKALAKHGAALHVVSGEFSDPVTEARNALIDMVALSRCDWLLHSRHSTFSVTAALLGRIPKRRQVDVDRNSLKLAVKQFIQARA